MFKCQAHIGITVSSCIDCKIERYLVKKGGYYARSGDHITMTKEDWSEALSGMSEEQIERSFDRWE